MTVVEAHLPAIEPAATRTHARVAWGVWLVSMALTALGLWFLVLTRDTPTTESWGFPGFPAIFAVTFSTVGAVVVARRPRNRLGWLLAALGIASSVQLFLQTSSLYGLVERPGSIPGAQLLAWAGALIWIPLVTGIGLFLLLFPDGRLPAGRWRLAPIALLAGAGLSALQIGLSPGPLYNYQFVANPLGVEALAPWLPLMRALGFATMLLGYSASALSLVVRFRASSGEQRRQFKWVAFAAAIVAIVSPLGFSDLEVGEAIFILAVAGIPIAAGIAIVRSRLWDIDAIINRSLVYGALTAILAGLYTASIRLFNGLFVALTGEESDATLVITTLLLATTFTPIKRRLERIVERRLSPAAAGAGESQEPSADPDLDERVRRIAREEFERLRGG
jgi:uncharacterized membrane protein